VDFERPPDEELLLRMCQSMQHRGPDSRGIYLTDTVGLAAQRLAIIDLVGGIQPVTNEDGSVVAVMNGEIYNHVELRNDLTRRGHRFNARVDTEVLVHLYEEYGDALVQQLRGMFAFAIWDVPRERLLCARDRVGKKPFFWTRRGRHYAFASEVQCLLQDREQPREIDPRAIDAYLTFQYVPHPLSAFRGIHKLPPASTLVVSDCGDTVNRYWRLDYSGPRTKGCPAELEEAVLAQIDEATRIRLMSDVPLGAFLSGGVDSSAVVAAMAKHVSGPVKTFSIGFPERDWDETHYARTVAERFATDHHEFEVRPEALSIMPKLARHYGEPYADSSAIPSFYLAELTANHVTVALNGDGGDESFAGYGRYRRGLAVGRLDWLPRRLQRAAPLIGDRMGRGRSQASLLGRVRRLSHALAMEDWERYTMSLTSFDREGRRRLLTPEFAASLDGWDSEQLVCVPWSKSSASNVIDTMLDVDVQTYLPGDLLPKMDIATMAHSLEARSPFLDHRLMEFAVTLPPELKLDSSGGKKILKSALLGTLPREIVNRPKMGFGVPLDRWFRDELRDLPGERLLDRDALDRGYFRRDQIERIIREHQSGQADHALRIWTLLQLEMWHREVVECPIAAPKGV
jgi:asparagine synthase (glutamine-hydrolysing)